MNDLKTTPLNEIIFELASLEKEIDLKIMKYNLLAQEVCRRFPLPDVEDTFKPKVLSKGEIKI